MLLKDLANRLLFLPETYTINLLEGTPNEFDFSSNYALHLI
jgi:hypothetical protein